MPQFPSFSVWNYSHLLKILIFFRYCHHEDPDFCVHPGSLYRFRDVERWVLINASFVVWFCNCILKLSSLHLTQFRQSYSPLSQTWPGKNPGVKNFTEESSVLLRFRSPTRVRSHDRDYGWKWGLYPCMFFWKKIRLETISQFSILKHFFTLSVSFTSVLRFWQRCKKKIELARDYKCDMGCYNACIEDKWANGEFPDEEWGECDDKCCHLRRWR